VARRRSWAAEASRKTPARKPEKKLTWLRTHVKLPRTLWRRMLRNRTLR
jgi:hypothetical protein